MPSRAESLDEASIRERTSRTLIGIGTKVLGGIETYLSDTSNLPALNSLDLTTHEVIKVATGKPSLMHNHVIAGQLSLEGTHDSLVETRSVIVAKG